MSAKAIIRIEDSSKIPLSDAISIIKTELNLPLKAITASSILYSNDFNRKIVLRLLLGKAFSGLTPPDRTIFDVASVKKSEA